MPAIPVGTHVCFTPPRIYDVGRQTNTGVIQWVSDESGGSVDYRIGSQGEPSTSVGYGLTMLNGPIIQTMRTVGPESIETVTVVSDPEPTPEPAPEPAHIIPRTAQDAIAQATALATVSHLMPDAQATAAALQGLAEWLPGGPKQDTGHEHAAMASLCGEYEAIVCPTFGWSPRNGETSSMYRHTLAWQRELDEFERNHGGTPLDAITQWAGRYAAGGLANTAICDHAASHLEAHKIEGLNELLESFGWETVEDIEREYNITARATRMVREYRWIQQSQYVTVSAEAGCEEGALEYAQGNIALHDYVNSNDWTTDDGSEGDWTLDEDDVQDCDEEWENATVELA